MQRARWENPENNRYFEVWLGLDLFGSLIMVKQWGGKNSHAGGIATELFESEKEAEKAVETIHKRRIQHKYRLRSTTITLTPPAK